MIIAVSLALLLTPIAPLDADEFQGSQSCASATCHGGAVGRGPVWNSSFSLSRSADPHATAGLRLYDADSQRIVSLLAPDVLAPAQQGEIEPAKQGVMDPIKYAGVLRQRCISCHTSASASEAMVSGELSPQLVSDGVSCKSCHGSADRWLTEHVKVSWQGTKRFEPATGMRDTESIVGRAETCVRCHVGSRSSDGLIRDMNHDLIAAGHPALRFDLWIYNQNLPHHWASDSSNELHFEESVLRVREVGRRVAAAAAADLSAERAQDSMIDSSATTGLNAEAAVPWPELSDFNCFACHQSLKPQTYQKWLAPADELTKLTASTGLPLWNAWFTAQSPDARAALKALIPRPGNQQSWVDSMNQLAAGYRSSLASLETQPLNPLERATAIKQSLATTMRPRDWHDAAVVFLDLDAAARDLERSPETAEKGSELRKKLRDQVALTLRFAAAETPEDERRRSPFTFDANAFHSAATTALEYLIDKKP